MPTSKRLSSHVLLILALILYKALCTDKEVIVRWQRWALKTKTFKTILIWKEQKLNWTNKTAHTEKKKKKYCMLQWKENILIFSRQQKPRNWLECRMPDKPIFAAGPPVVPGPLVEWGAAPLYSSSSSLYVWRDISAALLTDYRLSYSSCCVWRAETEGGHANSFLCTVSSDETVTLFGAVFPLVCLCLSGPSGRHGGRQGCKNRGVMGWKGEEVMTSGCFMSDGGWFVFSGACCWHLHTLELLAGKAGRDRGVAGCKLAHWHSDRQSGPWEWHPPWPVCGSAGSRWQGPLEQTLVWKYHLKEHTPLRHPNHTVAEQTAV